MMKFYWMPLFILALINPVYAKEEIENLLQNPDFEDFGTAPWILWVEDANAIAQMMIDKKESLDGKQSLMVDISKKGSGMRV